MSGQSWGRWPAGIVVFLLVLTLVPGWLTPKAAAEQVDCGALRDNTIFQENNNTNGIGTWFAAGQINAGSAQRGLIQFDLSGIPSDATVTKVTLNLYVTGVPKSDKANARPFWLQPLQGIGEPSWGEGDKDALDVGQGVPATPGDGSATWYFKQYDTAGWPTGREGAWDPGPLGDAAGIVPGGITPDPLPTSPFLVSWTKSLPTDPMLIDVQNWVSGRVANSGWVMLGEEGIPLQTSSKRQFASHEAAAAYRPTLKVEYVPEPSAWLLGLVGAAALAGCAWRLRRPDSRLPAAGEGRG